MLRSYIRYPSPILFFSFRPKILIPIQILFNILSIVKVTGIEFLVQTKEKKKSYQIFSSVDQVGYAIYSA